VYAAVLAGYGYYQVARGYEGCGVVFGVGIS
jgi:hypothetical protein